LRKKALSWLEEFKSPQISQKILAQIKEFDLSYTFMEVCGTHTVSILRSGVRSLLPKNIKHISGPGCPVCVTSQGDCDLAVEAASIPNICITTFGDMLKVPGSKSNLAQARSEGKHIEIIYGPLDALKYAAEHPEIQVVFLGIGFETTAPTVAATVKKAKEQNIDNFSVLSFHKIVPPALNALLSTNPKIDGFIYPGHVSTVIGIEPYRDVLKKFNKGGVIAGFEPVDILSAILELLKMKQANQPNVLNNYSRAVRDEGNPNALKFINEVFATEDAEWRGMGIIPDSGLRFRDEYKSFCAKTKFGLKSKKSVDPPGCRCGEVLQGLIEPYQCPLFGKACTPIKPVGPCMVSSEGSCAAHYKYGEM
jgi:hydrogenase expression/formation protein HypD